MRQVDRRKQFVCRLALAVLLCGVDAAGPLLAQDAPASRARQTRVAGGPWFGEPLPPPFGKEPAVIVGKRAPRPFVPPAGESASPELVGASIRKDLEAIVGISKESRATHEIGDGGLWGRISGYPSGTKAINYAIEQFKKAGIADVRSQPISQEPNARFWMPLSWEVRLLGDPALGAGSGDVVLESAVPLAPSDIPGETLTAPLVYVGTASPAVLRNIDVKGKVAVQLIVPQGHMLFERGAVASRSAELVKRGAVGVFNLVRLPGNERSWDFRNCGNPCFNLGGRDGYFLENVLDRAAQAGLQDKVRARISLKSETRSNLKAENGIAVIPGSQSDEVLVIDAHVDAWFDGAGDNADGFSVMLALARHFAKPENKPRRTMVFIASAGHHSPGINGPSSFLAANPDLAKKAVLVLNIEHVAQRNFSVARSEASDGYRQAIADSGEAPAYAGINNKSPFINDLFEKGVLKYGNNFVSDESDMGSGEMGGFQPVKAAALVTIIQAPPLYHTTGETLDVISTPGLERVARFLAFFLSSVDKAARTQIIP
jgi:Peptidase family M28